MTWKRLLLVLAALILAAGGVLFFWARAVLTGDGARTALEAQLTRALGQPVTIGRVQASIFPRITVNLRDVAIGQPARISVTTLHLGADLRALLSRRIEHAAVQLDGATIELPLPPFAFASAPADPGAGGAAPVQIGSIDTVALHNVAIVSGGRTLRGTVDVVPSGVGMEIRRATLEADGTSLEITGAIADFAGPSGELTVVAKGLNVLEVLAFVNDFAKGATGTSSMEDRRASSMEDRGASSVEGRVFRPGQPMHLTVSLQADRAVVGPLLLDGVSGRARITRDLVRLDPIRFGAFGGAVSGVVSSALGRAPNFHVSASLTHVDVATVATFAGSPGAITGSLSGTIDVGGTGTTAEAVIASAKGGSRVEIADGTVKGLGLVRGVVLATSMRQDSRAALGGDSPSSASEPFSRIAATLTIAGGQATTDNVQFSSKDVDLTGAGALGLRDLAVDVAGRVQLSDELSRQAGRDLLRYTKEDGRVTLPVHVTGTPGRFRVTLDAGEAAQRALKNRATEEAAKALGRVLGRIIKK